MADNPAIYYYSYHNIPPGQEVKRIQQYSTILDRLSSVRCDDVMGRGRGTIARNNNIYSHSKFYNIFIIMGDLLITPIYAIM